MYWTGAHGPRFIRPIRWIVAILTGKVVPFSFAGVNAGNRTDGHRFLGKRNIQVSGPRDYELKLKKNFVICRPEERREKIETESARRPVARICERMKMKRYLNS